MVKLGRQNYETPSYVGFRTRAFNGPKKEVIHTNVIQINELPATEAQEARWSQEAQRFQTSRQPPQFCRLLDFISPATLVITVCS